MRIFHEIANLHPDIRHRRDRGDLAQDPVRAGSDDETTEEIKIVDVLRAHGHLLADRADEADDVDEDAGNVGSVSAPVEAEPEIVWGGFTGGVELLDLEIAAADEVVVGDDDTGDGGQEDGVCGEVGGKVVGGRE